MADLEQQLQGLLSNPALMQQLFSMANSIGIPQPQTAPPQNGPSSLPFDPAVVRQLQQVMTSARLEPRQQELLHALGAYLPSERIRRLEKAMQAAKFARFAAALPRENGGS